MNLARSHKLGTAAVLGLEAYSRRHVAAPLYRLIQLRASWLNGCEYCIHLHAKDLRRNGETPERIDALMEEALPQFLFTPSELSALRLTDELTMLRGGGVTDATWSNAQRYFSDQALGDLVIGIATIGVWNRIGIATRRQP